MWILSRRVKGLKEGWAKLTLAAMLEEEQTALKASQVTVKWPGFSLKSLRWWWGWEEGNQAFSPCSSKLTAHTGSPGKESPGKFSGVVHPIPPSGPQRHPPPCSGSIPVDKLPRGLSPQVCKCL